MQINHYPQEFLNQVRTAQTFEINGDPSSAESLYLNMLERWTFKTEIFTALAQIYQAIDEQQKLCECIRQLTQLNPEQYFYKISLAGCQVKLGNFALATETLDAIPNERAELNIVFEKARLYSQLENYDAAIRCYYQLLNKKPTNPEIIHNNLANIYTTLRREERSEFHLSMAMNIEPGYLPAMINYGSMLEERGDRKTAKETYLKILQRDPQNVIVISRLIPLLDENEISVFIQKISGILERPLETSDEQSLKYSLADLLNRIGRHHQAFAMAKSANEIADKSSAYDKLKQEGLTHSIKKFNVNSMNRGKVAAIESSQNYSPIFICGAYRSGSTLAEQLIATNKNVSALGEISFWGPKERQSIWQCVRQQCVPSNDLSLQLRQTYLDKLTNAIGEGIFTDKNLDNIMWVGILKQVFPRAKFVLMQRNILDTAISMFFTQFKSSLNYTTNIENAIHYLEQLEEVAAHWKKLFPEDVHVLAYENLVNAPERVSRELFDFLQLDWSNEVLKFYKNNQKIRTASIWQARSPIYNKSINRWKNFIRDLDMEGPSVSKYLIE